MAQIGLWATVKDWIGGVAFAIYLWSQSLTADEYFDLLESDAKHRRGLDADTQPCPKCAGKGTFKVGVYHENCIDCKGLGRVKRVSR